MAKKTHQQNDKIYVMYNTRDRKKAGVRSSVPNCGYSEDQLASMAKFGWKVKAIVKEVKM